MKNNTFKEKNCFFKIYGQLLGKIGLLSIPASGRTDPKHTI